jgi:hypothetical protein
MTTQEQITERFEREIPERLRQQFAHLSYGEMASRPECAEYADALEDMETAWFDAEE